MTDDSYATLRASALAARRALTATERHSHSATITRAFLRSAHFYKARNIACYLSADDEVDTAAVFERAWRTRKRIFAPVILPRHALAFVEVTSNTRLTKNRFGIWQPSGDAQIETRKLDVCIAPTVAFDDAGHRIGMGGGYYDRAFAYQKNSASLRRPRLLGLAFECQKVEEIRPNPWDIPLYRVFTERD